MKDDPRGVFFGAAKGAETAEEARAAEPVHTDPRQRKDSPPSLTVTLRELHDPESGRLDAGRIAEYLSIPLKSLSELLGRGYSTVQKTPAAPSLQPTLRSVKRILEILEQVLVHRAAVLAWLNSPHPDLGRRTPLDVILQGYPDAVEDMLESALAGTPS
jgi:hypothetical protein